MKYDIVITVIPFIQPSPQTGPAILKAVLQKEGFKCKVIDWNYDLIQRCNNGYNERVYGETDPIMRNFYEKNFDSILNEWIDELKVLKPKWIGLSIFSFRTCRPIINKICEKIRLQLPDTKIVAGGHGVSIPISPLGDELLKKELIDYYISGDGEESLVKLLKHKKNIKGLNNTNDPAQVLNLNVFPPPDYSDTPPNIYPKETFVISSRGCIMNCQFCSSYYKKFVIRDPKLIVEEIIDLNYKYNSKLFFFADSLTNGNSTHILNIANFIIHYNNKNILPKIMWSCDWICRSKKIINEKIYKQISKSGCSSIIIGLESGSEKVRKDMRKPIKDIDIYFLVEQCKKYNIIINMLFMIGYYTETEYDHKLTLDLIKIHSRSS